MRTINRDIVAPLIFSKDGKTLQTLQSAENKRCVYPGHWGIIGGGMEESEDQRTALNRETLEESGIDISSYTAELIHESEGEAEKTLDTGERVFCKMKFHTYKVVINDRMADEIKVTLNDEHTEYRWVEPPQLKHLKLTPQSVGLFKQLGYI